MILKIELEMIKKIGLDATVFFSYLKKYGDNIKAEGFFSVKLKTVEKDLDIKRVSLKNAIRLLENKKYIKTMTLAKGIITNVRFKIIHIQNEQTHGVFKYVNTASKPLKTRVLEYVNTAASTVHLNTSTPHKHDAPSIYSYITINSNILKRKNNLGENSISSDVRKNILSLLTLKEGYSKKQTPSPLVKKPIKKAFKRETNSDAKGGISKREKTLILAEEILNYLNQKTGKKFRINAVSNSKHILARISEGYTLEEFKLVIDKKTLQWSDLIFSNGQPASNYLRPATLFNSKNFENYLNENNLSKPNNKKFKSDLDRDLYNFFKKNNCQGS
jgi:uncharacterized phage protein (TIGR02220 family)|tara:strand:+ start:1438 stop:2430 length:993 start_codon:yes stop_codon:yes gene_type:complete